MKSIFKTTYENNVIEVINTWFNGERLIVNGILQDDQVNCLSANLTGHLIGGNGKKVGIKANLGGFFKISCRLFVNDQKVEVIQIK